jgi:hypothetical protein
MSNKNSKNMSEEKSQKQKDGMSLGISSVCVWSATPLLRYVRVPRDSAGTIDLRLQQMWRGSDGSVKWEWVEEIDVTDI